LEDVAYCSIRQFASTGSAKDRLATRIFTGRVVLKTKNLRRGFFFQKAKLSGFLDIDRATKIIIIIIIIITTLIMADEQELFLPEFI
jgi:hypothetical protein